jgi:hypothetical protein
MIGPACDRVPVPEVDREAITAWRCWFVLPEECLLRPIYKRGLAWKPREALEAVCPDKLHEVPADRCKCGVWAASEPENLHEVKWTFSPPKGIDPLPGVLVVGQISMWGRLIEHERGWRSSHAYPKHLYVFADDPVLAAALRDTYLVPVEYGDKAQALAEQLPGAKADDEPAPAAPPAPPRPVAPPAPPDHKAPFLAVIEGMKADSALKAQATICLDGISSWWYEDVAKGRESVNRRDSSLNATKAKLEGAILRGGYYPNFYGDAWKEHLRREIKTDAVDLVAAFAAHRAIEGDRTAARRFVWLQIASRWRAAQATYREAAHLQERMKSKRNRRTGRKLSPATVGLHQSRFSALSDELKQRLLGLVGIPTPSYREWRKLTGGA